MLECAKCGARINSYGECSCQPYNPHVAGEAGRRERDRRCRHNGPSGTRCVREAGHGGYCRGTEEA